MNYYEIDNKKECFEIVVSMFREIQSYKQSKKNGLSEFEKEMERVKSMPTKIKEKDLHKWQKR